MAQPEIQVTSTQLLGQPPTCDVIEMPTLQLEICGIVNLVTPTLLITNAAPADHPIKLGSSIFAAIPLDPMQVTPFVAGADVHDWKNPPGQTMPYPPLKFSAVPEKPKWMAAAVPHGCPE